MQKELESNKNTKEMLKRKSRGTFEDLKGKKKKTEVPPTHYVITLIDEGSGSGHKQFLIPVTDKTRSILKRLEKEGEITPPTAKYLLPTPGKEIEEEWKLFQLGKNETICPKENDRFRFLCISNDF